MTIYDDCQTVCESSCQHTTEMQEVDVDWKDIPLTRTLVEIAFIYRDGTRSVVPGARYNRKVYVRDQVGVDIWSEYKWRYVGIVDGVYTFTETSG